MDAAARESMVKQRTSRSVRARAWLESTKRVFTCLHQRAKHTSRHARHVDVDTGIKNVEVELERLTAVEDEELLQSYDDLFIDACSAVRPVDSSRRKKKKKKKKKKKSTQGRR